MNEQLHLFDDTDLQPKPKKKGKTAEDFADYNGFVEKFKPKKLQMIVIRL